MNFLCLAMIFIVILWNVSSLKSYATKKGTGYFLLWLSVALYSVFYSPVHDDNYASLESYYAYSSGIEETYLHFEPIYFRIMDIIPYGYAVWRFFIWGIGALILTLYIKWMRFDINVSTVILLYFALPLLNYQRAIIGYLLLYIALSLLVKLIDENGNLVKKTRQLMIASVCIMAALPFHNSMPFYVFIMLISFFLPANRNTLGFCLLGCLVLSVTDMGSLFLSYTSEETQRTAEYYLEDAKLGNSANFFGLIEQLCMYGPYYTMLAFCAWNINSVKLCFTRYEKTVLTNAVLLILVSLAYSTTSSVVQGKFYMASLLPWALFLVSFYTRDRKNIVAVTYAKWTLYAFIGSSIIKILSGSIVNLI